MKIYLISQNKNNSYDTYDSAVVVAKSPKMAARIHPSNGEMWDPTFPRKWDELRQWVEPEQVDVECIGTAESGLPVGVVVASFNAG